ncbi:MAG: heme exporter protein CcmB [Candidatus Pedobacter colombiensis]|uniref:Heme exporter protein CcmB n=1 Tax=Candidatus Pedobacter colombiensis TaxID=3121371 RepID=A0AAJ5W7D4_9SPHI|nr:heme exporter protein CcmB [Pedobacter sp.]WEK18344.1 MAG: heme exporter protein CcmB [Pedobacter sp.]
MNLVSQVKHLIKKELLLEWRSKYTLNGVLLYVVSTVFVCFLSFVSVDKITWNALFWIIMLFASINAVSKSFLQESKGRQLYIYTIASPAALIISKTVYNVLLMLLLTVIALGFYMMVFGYVPEDLPMYLLATVLGSLSFSTIFTMVSAIASKAGNGGMLMAILSFPIIIPVLVVLIRLTKNAIDGLDRSVSWDEVGVLLVINVLVMAVSLLLFPYLWRD